MKSPSTENDQRNDIRIRDRILLQYKEIDEKVYEQLIHDIEEGIICPWTECSHPYFTKRISRYLKKIKEKDENLAGALEILDQKLSLLLNLLDEEKHGYRKAFKLVPVNLSASGIAFDIRKRMPKGHKLELHIGLLPEHYFFQCYAEILRMDKSSKENMHTVAARFIWITEDDQERLIEHIFQHQVIQLRMRRKHKEMKRKKRPRG